MLSILPSLVASLATTLPAPLPNLALPDQAESQAGGQAKKSAFNYTYVEGNLVRVDIFHPDRCIGDVPVGAGEIGPLIGYQLIGDESAGRCGGPIA